MSTRIETFDDYKNFLNLHFPGDDPGNGTTEGVNASLFFPADVHPLTFTRISTYQECVWEVMCSEDGQSLAPQASALDVLRFYYSKGEGYFSPEVAKDYGKAFFSQLPTVVERLKKDSTTRQAVIRMPDDACLLSVQFLLRTEPLSNSPVLVTIANFRSSDAIHGLPTDLYILQQLQSRLMLELQSSLSTVAPYIILNAGSLHIYKKDEHFLN